MILSHLPQSLGKYLSQKVPSEWGHTDARVKNFYARTFNDFANEYLKSFLSQLPTELTQVEIGGRIFKPLAYCRKVCGDSFKARFRQRCIKETYQLWLFLLLLAFLGFCSSTSFNRASVSAQVFNGYQTVSREDSWVWGISCVASAIKEEPKHLRSCSWFCLVGNVIIFSSNPRNFSQICFNCYTIHFSVLPLFSPGI